MAGLYLHIPFCRRKCFYCDFYSVATLSATASFHSALLLELSLRKDYLRDEVVETIYFGGGTPSVLSVPQIVEILDTIRKNFRVAPGAEVSLEANPDDVDPDYSRGLLETGINRLSIGIQSFSGSTLQWMNRLHDAGQSHRSIETALQAGFQNINADLIFGYRGLEDLHWVKELETVLASGIHHLSAYQLSIEPGTAFHLFEKKGQALVSGDDQTASQYRRLIQVTGEKGFHQYEISNFARDGYRSKHNSAYWSGKSYLGLGPSAHSFNGFSRQWNKSHIREYIDGAGRGLIPHELEHLDFHTRFNEYIMTRLRTTEGIQIQEVVNLFGPDFGTHLNRESARYIRKGWLVLTGECLSLTTEGFLMANTVMAGLMQDRAD